NDTEPFLVREYRFAQLVPALIEQVHVADLFSPLRCWMMRRMRSAGRKLDEERRLRRQRIHAIHIFDRFISHRGHQIPARLALVWINRRRIADEVAGLPLIGVAAHEAIEIFKAHPGRPLVEWASLT